MAPKTFIFMGRSGSGKGTQGRLLEGELKKRDGRAVFYLETGAKFRDFVAGSSHSSRLAHELMEKGLLQPSFLAVWNWASTLISQMTGEEHLIIDGTPRMLPEALMFDTALQFYKRTPAVFIYLDTHHDEAKERLTLRGRPDDSTPERIAARMDWFEREVMPVVEHYRSSPLVQFIEINGNQTIEAVQAELMAKLAGYLND